MRILFCVILALFFQMVHASAILVHDDSKFVITAKSHIYFYGLVDAQLAQEMATEINQVWNEDQHQVILNQVSYDLKFEITASVTTLNNARKLSLQMNPINNFIRIISGPTDQLTASFMVGTTNSGVWLLTDRLGVSKTTAHEYGHCLGLEHPEGETYFGLPRIMITRYYNPDLDLRERKVSEADILELNIEDATTTLGQFNITFLFDEEGNFLAN